MLRECNARAETELPRNKYSFNILKSNQIIFRKNAIYVMLHGDYPYY